VVAIKFLKSQYKSKNESFWGPNFECYIEIIEMYIYLHILLYFVVAQPFTHLFKKF
jgi:hypothetical protein